MQMHSIPWTGREDCYPWQLTFDLLGIAARNLTGLHSLSPLRLKVDVPLVAAQREHACAPDQGQHCCILETKER